MSTEAGNFAKCKFYCWLFFLFTQNSNVTICTNSYRVVASISKKMTRETKETFLRVLNNKSITFRKLFTIKRVK